MAHGRSGSEAGAVLIVVALAAVVLLLFAGLAVDTGVLKAAKREQADHAYAAATAALNAYDLAGGDPVTRLNAATARAEEIVHANVQGAMTTYHLAHPAAAQELGAGVGSSGADGGVIPGVWHPGPTWDLPHFDPLTGECIGPSPCPCDDRGRWAGPCLQVLQFARADDLATPVTAFHAELRLRGESPLETTFMRLAGQAEMTVSSRATVAYRPLRVVFLVDLSRASHGETHLPYERYGAGRLPFHAPVEVAFRLVNKSCGPGSPYLRFPGDDGYDPGELTCQPLPVYPPCVDARGAVVNTSAWPPTDCVLDGGSIDGQWSALFNHYCRVPVLVPTRLPDFHPHRLHARDEYRCLTIRYREGEDEPRTDHYLVDLYRGRTADLEPYMGPEPLNSMLSAVAAGLERIRNQGVDGDRVALIGFDQRADMDIRRIPRAGMSATDDAGFAELEVLAAESGNLLERHRDHFFFSREDALLSIPSALRVAHRLLAEEPGFHAADNHVVLLTGGVSHCHVDEAGVHACATTEEAVRRSIDQSVGYVIDELVPEQIRLHVILVGEMVRPHTIVRRGGTEASEGRCMDEREGRENGLSFADPLTDSATIEQAMDGARENGGEFTGSLRYLYPNRLEEAVSATNGVWGAVRPACAPGAAQLAGGLTCEQGGLEAFLDGACGSLPGRGEPLGAVPGITDGSGRLYCDPRCRGRREQMAAYIDSALDRNPYVRVDDSTLPR